MHRPPSTTLLVIPAYPKPLSYVLVPPTTLSELTSFQILYGQSIGGAVAIDLASRNPSIVRFSIVASRSSTHKALRSAP
jgi:hypothetical protein